MPTIFLIRHCESQSNAGLPTSIPQIVALTARGVEQAKHIAAFLKYYTSVDLIITPPYLRTKQIVVFTNALFPSISINEWPVQEFTYLSSIHQGYSTVEERRPLVGALWEHCLPSFRDGPISESFEQFMQHVQEVMARLKGTNHENIAVFSHEQFFSAFLWLIERREVVDISSWSMYDFRNLLMNNPVLNNTIVKARFRHSEHRWHYERIVEHLNHFLWT